MGQRHGRRGLAATGAVAIAPSNPNIVWVGGGDQANARSSLSGKGVFKSTDAGKTWQSMGLPDSHHIARIVIDPKNPDIVYVAAMGHLFSKNEERGVFKTTDGGQHWKKVLYINDGVGAIDLVINRKTPTHALRRDVRQRPHGRGRSSRAVRRAASSRARTAARSGPSSAADCRPARSAASALDLYQKNPQILYALLENQNPASGAPDQPGRGAGRGAAGGGAGGAAGAGRAGAAGGVSATAPLAQGIIGNELYRSDDGGKTWTKTSPTNVAGGKAPYSFNQIKIDPNNDQVVIANSDSMYITRDGGKTWQTGFFRGAFGDYPLHVVGSG